MAKFNIGDKAILTEKGIALNGFEVGDIVTVAEIVEGDLLSVTVEHEDGHRGYTSPDNLKHLEETAYKVGDKVRILDVDAIMFGKQCFSDGDVTEVVGFYLGNEGMPELKATKGPDDDLFIDLDEEGHAIEKVEDSEEKEFDIVALFDRVSKLEAKVAELVGGELSPSEEEHIRTLAARKTSNARRKEAIEKARDFVEDTLLTVGDYHLADKGNDAYRDWISRAEFIVNEEKRTVVALIRPKTLDEVISKGIAKCNPEDVFNEDIGKAIALGRAYGLDAEISEFEYAPQPDKVEVGMLVKFRGNLFDAEAPVFEEDGFHTSVDNLCENPDTLIRIISDSEAKY